MEWNLAVHLEEEMQPHGKDYSAVVWKRLDGRAHAPTARNASRVPDTSCPFAVKT